MMQQPRLHHRNDAAAEAALTQDIPLLQGSVSGRGRLVAISQSLAYRPCPNHQLSDPTTPANAFSDLPVEIAIRILGLIPYHHETLLSLTLVNRYFRTIIRLNKSQLRKAYAYQLWQGILLSDATTGSCASICLNSIQRSFVSIKSLVEDIMGATSFDPNFTPRLRAGLYLLEKYSKLPESCTEPQKRLLRVSLRVQSDAIIRATTTLAAEAALARITSQKLSYTDEELARHTAVLGDLNCPLSIESLVVGQRRGLHVIRQLLDIRPSEVGDSAQEIPDRSKSQDLIDALTQENGRFRPLVTQSDEWCAHVTWGNCDEYIAADPEYLLELTCYLSGAYHSTPLGRSIRLLKAAIYATNVAYDDEVDNTTLETIDKVYKRYKTSFEKSDEDPKWQGWCDKWGDRWFRGYLDEVKEFEEVYQVGDEGQILKEAMEDWKWFERRQEKCDSGDMTDQKAFLLDSLKWANEPVGVLVPSG